MTTPVPAPASRATAVHLGQVVPHTGATGVVPVPAGLVALGHIGSPIASTSSGTFGVPFAVHLSGFLVTTQHAQSGVRLVTPSRSEPPISTPLKSAISAGSRPIDGAVSLDTITPRNEIRSEEATLDQAADDGAPQVLVPPLTAPGASRIPPTTDETTGAPRSGSASRVKIPKGSQYVALPVAQNSNGQSATPIVAPAFGIALPAPSMVPCLTLTDVIPPATSGASLITVAHTKDADVRKEADPHRLDSVVAPTGPAPETAHATAPGSPMASSASDGAVANNLERSAAPSEPALSATRSEVSPAVVPVTETSTSQSQSQPQIQAALPTDRATPADQVAAPLIGVIQSAGGTPSVTVRLQPPELGHVQIRVDQSAPGAPHITITADRPETMQLLQHDEPVLRQALDQAGVQSTGRTISFQVAAPDQVAGAASRSDGMTATLNDSGQGQSGGLWRENEDASRNSGQGSASDQRQPHARWFRAGLDITA